MFNDPVFRYIFGIGALILSYGFLYILIGVAANLVFYGLDIFNWSSAKIWDGMRYGIEHITPYHWIFAEDTIINGVKVKLPGVWEHVSRTREVEQLIAVNAELQKQLTNLRDRKTVWGQDQLSFLPQVKNTTNGHKPLVYLRNIGGYDYMLTFKNADHKYCYNHQDKYAWVERVTHTRDQESKKRRPEYKYRWVKRPEKVEDKGEEFFNKATDEELLRNFPPTWKINGKLEWIPFDCLPFRWEKMDTQEPIKEWELVQEKLL